MSGILERIAIGMGVLTDEERAALEEVADATGKPKIVYQVYDDSRVTDNMIGIEKVGHPHVTLEEAVKWAEGKLLESFSVYREIRCITRKREIWYMQGQSAAYSMN